MAARVAFPAIVEDQQLGAVGTFRPAPPTRSVTSQQSFVTFRALSRIHHEVVAAAAGEPDLSWTVGYLCAVVPSVEAPQIIDCAYLEATGFIPGHSHFDYLSDFEFSFQYSYISGSIGPS
jgi:hypothetical protein